ncbi:DGQHR domain-containing protein [Sinorhizobium fredii]|uniref:DGQHR domain-containing protein n=1 Tax=Rhizobium fredii TaxID=380 RepID=UPI00059561F7|nr:DGQHR domain-containing protein [Sinorhizobium fredii]WOS65838.1 DGQHR domain-containing protein [Sinorhizobium fredii GR64]
MDLIEDHIAYAEPHIRRILFGLRAAIRGLDPRIIERATPAQRIVYLIDRIFAEVKVQKRCVLVRFFDRGVPDPERKVRHVEHAQKNGWQHDKEIRLYDLNAVDYAVQFISAALEVVATPLIPQNSFSINNFKEAEVSMSTTITIPAARVRQGDLTLYATALKVRDLIRPGFYTVETLDPTDMDDKGYQRLLNKSRARKLADYVVKGQDARDAFLPTSVFLATDKAVPFDEAGNTITIDVANVGPFNVVDGQHRLEGLKVASEKDSRVLDFEVPVNVAVNLPTLHQMCHFLIVNSTQKSVDKSVEQRIVARLTEALDVEDIPSLPRWILNTVEKGEVERAIKYVDFLNDQSDSPWCDKIRKANDDVGPGRINQSSFAKAIQKYVLTANNPISAIMDFDKERRIFLNYWKAICSILDDGNSETLYKYGGVELFCQFSVPFFMKLQTSGNYRVETMESLLQSCFDNIEGEYAGVGHPEWWRTGGQAGRLNSGALRLVSNEMAKALNKSSMAETIQI